MEQMNNKSTVLARSFDIVICVLVPLAYFVLFFTLHVLKWKNYDPSCLDVQSIVDIFLDFIHGRFKGECIFSPASFISSLGLYIFKSPYYILAIAPLFTALQLALLYAIGLKATKSRAISFALMFSYALHPWIEIYSMLGFKPEPIGGFFLFLFIYLMLDKRSIAASLAAFAAILSKIDVVPIVFLTSIWFYVKFDKRTARPAIASSIAGGFMYLFFALFVLLARDTLDSMGGNLEAAFESIRSGKLLQNPASLFSPSRVSLFLLMFPTGFLCLLAPLLTIVPSIIHIAITIVMAGAWDKVLFADSFLFFPDNPWLHLPKPPITWIAMIYLGAVFGIRGLLKKVSAMEEKSRLKHGAVALVLIVFSLFYHYVAAVPYFAGPLPLSPWWSEYRHRYQASTRTEHLDRIVRRIEKDRVGCCLSGEYPMHLDGFIRGEWWNRANRLPCDYEEINRELILVDLLLHMHPPRKEVLNWTLMMLENPRYEVESFEEGILLLRLKKGHPPSGISKDTVKQFILNNYDILILNLYDPVLYQRAIDLASDHSQP